MENSGNLKYQSVPILLNTPTAANINVYKDSISGLHNLVLPAHGKSIPLGADTQISVSLPNIATKKVFGIDVVTSYPNTTGVYDYGFTVDAKRKQPGVDNDEYYPKMFHVYGKMNLQAADSDGLIEEADRLAMVYDLVAQANANTELTDIVEVGYKFIMEITFETTTGLEFGGNSLPTDFDHTCVRNTEGITVVPMALISTNKYKCLVLVPYSVGKPNAAAIATITDIGVYFRSKTEVWDFDVRFDDLIFDAHKFSYGIYTANIAAAVKHRINYGANTTDTGGTEDDNADLATFLTAIDGIYSLGDNEASAEFTTYYSELPVSIYPLEGSALAAPASTTYTNYASVTMWKQLTADQVYKVFAHKHFGELDPLVRHDRGLDVEYVKIAIVHKGHTHASMHSASGFGQGEQRMHIYMPKTKFEEDIFAKATSLDSAIDAGTDNSVAMLLHAIVSDSYGKAVAVGSWDDFITAWDPD